jgi:hypothetical protein
MRGPEKGSSLEELVAEVMLTEARERHAEARRLVERGICPAQAKQKARTGAVEGAANTVQAIGDAWYAELAPPGARAVRGGG